MAENLDVRIRAIEDSLNPAYDKVITNQKEITRGVKKMDDETRSATSRMKDNWLAISGALAGAAVAGAAVFKALQAATAQQTGIRQMQRAVESFGVAWTDATAAQIESFAASRQAVTRFGDDVTRRMLTVFADTASELDLAVDQMLGATTLIQDIVEATGKSSDEAARLVAKAYAGELESLADLLPAQKEHFQELMQTASASERAAEAVEILVGQFGGAATAIDETDQQMANLDNTIEDLQEALGGMVVAVAPELETLIGLLRGVAEAVDDIRPSAGFLKDLIGSLVGTAIPMVGTTQRVMELTEHIQDQTANTLRLSEAFGAYREVLDQSQEQISSVGAAYTDALIAGQLLEEFQSRQARTARGLAGLGGFADEIAEDRRAAAEAERERQAAEWMAGFEAEREHFINRLTLGQEHLDAELQMRIDGAAKLLENQQANQAAEIAGMAMQNAKRQQMAQAALLADKAETKALQTAGLAGLAAAESLTVQFLDDGAVKETFLGLAASARAIGMYAVGNIPGGIGMTAAAVGHFAAAAFADSGGGGGAAATPARGAGSTTSGDNGFQSAPGTIPDRQTEETGTSGVTVYVYMGDEEIGSQVISAVNTSAEFNNGQTWHPNLGGN